MTQGCLQRGLQGSPRPPPARPGPARAVGAVLTMSWGPARPWGPEGRAEAGTSCCHPPPPLIQPETSPGRSLLCGRGLHKSLVNE